jgi:hypothetical protein
MFELLFMFVLSVLGTVARYIAFGAFDPLMALIILLFPVGSLAIYLISKKLAEKERAYQPKGGLEGWSFYNIQKSLQIRKPLFKGKVSRGYVKRYFPQKWKYIFGDIFGFNWYLNLEIEIDGELYDVRWYRSRWISQQDHWRIHKNGKQIGEAQTLINLKNTVNLKEAILYRFGDTSYQSSATTVTSNISLTHDNKVVGTMKRNHIVSNVQVIDVPEDKTEYIVALILHSYYFKN